MIRNRVRWGYGLLALLLTLSTVACGGDEPAPVVQPPAPPPAPPPFQPQAVEVALGESGNVTLMTTEDGGFTLNGEAFESGGTVAAENGNMYLLTLADGKWSAAYQASEAMVTLGITEEMVTLTKNEDGSYMIGDMAVTSGETTVTAENGNMYTLSMDEDGMWMATYVEPVQNVMLGTHGGSTMIKKSEDGSYWLGDMTVMNGTVVSGEGGREYTLMMGDDGMWMATFVEHVQTVMLGTHGGSTMVKKSEDGSYWVGDMTVMDGSTVTGEGGRMYTLMQGDDGMWMATYVEPVQTVMLGMSGTSVMIKKSEDGSDWLGDQTVMTGSTATAMYMGNTNTYSLTKAADGTWSASYVPEAGTVALGASGITIPAMRAEAGAWSATHPQTGETVMLTEGGMVTATNLAGNMNTYMLSSDGMGMWTAAYQSVMVSVMLGTSGDNAMLTRAEDGSYWYDGDAFMSGDEAMAENGNDYVLTMAADGSWSAMFRPDSMEIMGTGLTAYSREDDDMYDVESAGSGIELAASGMGEVTTSMGMFRVRMDDGMLLGQRIDAAKDDDTRYRTVGLDAPVDYIADNADTANVNEANTGIVIAGEKILFDDLLGRGSAMKAASKSDGMPGEFVNDAVKKLANLKTEAELYAVYQAENAGTQEYDASLTRIAREAQKAIDTIFDEGAMFATGGMVDLASCDVCAGLPYEDGDTATVGYTADTTKALRAHDTVQALDKLLDALSSVDAFVAATAKNGNGVFEDALPEADAMKAFSANKSSFDALFGTTGSTRYGAIMTMVRAGPDPDQDPDTEGTEGDVNSTMAPRAAVYDMKFHFDGFNMDTDDDGDVDDTDDETGNEELGRLGAFAYATTAETARARLLPQTGGATYVGGTMAVTPGKAQASQLYHGSMRIDVNFRSRSVFGRVSMLKDKDGNLWQYLDRSVSEIYLPRRFYDSLARFGGMNDGDNTNDEGVTGDDVAGEATIVYSETHGFPVPTDSNNTARFSGRFIGSDGGEIAGVWSLGQATDKDGTEAGIQADDARDIIYGSYGVERDTDRDRPDIDANADASSGAAWQATVVGGMKTDDTAGAEFTGSKTAGTLRLGKYFEGGDQGATDVAAMFNGGKKNNDFLLSKIFVAPDADPKKTVQKSAKHVDRATDYINKQRTIYEAYTALLDDSDSATADDNVGRQRAWANIINFVRSEIFGKTALTAPTDGRADDGVAALDRQSPLGSYYYPVTRTGNPDDDEAMDRIQALLDALSSESALGDALAKNGGGVFDSGPAERAGDTDTEPFGMDGRTVNNMWTAVGAQTTLYSLSTNYTRFGVWWHQGSQSANDAPGPPHGNLQEDTSDPLDGTADADIHAMSPNSYAYSWLNQSSYRRDRVEATYPSQGRATYTGRTLAVLDNLIFQGDAEVKVTWGAANDVGASGDPMSFVLPTFSNFRQIGNDDPLKLGNAAANKNDQSGFDIVDEISFAMYGTTPANITVTHDETNGNLGVTYDTTTTDQSDFMARITTTDIGADATDKSAIFMAEFVGESLDGPLGIMGIWTIRDFGSETATADNMRDDLFGSFGADLESFETLFRNP